MVAKVFFTPLSNVRGTKEQIFSRLLREKLPEYYSPEMRPYQREMYEKEEFILEFQQKFHSKKILATTSVLLCRKESGEQLTSKKEGQTLSSLINSIGGAEIFTTLEPYNVESKKDKSVQEWSFDNFIPRLVRSITFCGLPI